MHSNIMRMLSSFNQNILCLFCLKRNHAVSYLQYIIICIQCKVHSSDGQIYVTWDKHNFPLRYSTGASLLDGDGFISARWISHREQKHASVNPYLMWSKYGFDETLHAFILHMMSHCIVAFASSYGSLSLPPYFLHSHTAWLIAAVF